MPELRKMANFLYDFLDIVVINNNLWNGLHFEGKTE